MSERERASRFTTWYALAMTQEGMQTEYQQQWQKEYVSDIESKGPKFVVIARGPKSFLLAPENEPHEMFFRLSGMSQLMSKRYAPDAVIRGFDIYKLREAAE